MATTPLYGLHYPALSDAPNVPQWVQDLAEDVEAQIERIDDDFALTTVLPVWIRKPSTESVTSSTSLQNDDHFAFSVAANSVYALEGYVLYDGAQAANSPTSVGGLKSAFTGPAAASMSWTNFGGATEFAGDLATYNMVAQGLTTSRNVATQVTATATMSFQPKGTLVTGVNAGTLQYQWAQATSNATATRVLANSWMKLTKIG